MPRRHHDSKDRLAQHFNSGRFHGTPLRFIAGLMLILLPFASPADQLLPVSAQMPGSKACHTTYLFIFDFNRRIWLADEALTDQVDAMADVRRRRHRCYVFLDNFSALGSGSKQVPVALSNPVLAAGVIRWQIDRRQHSHTRQCN